MPKLSASPLRPFAPSHPDTFTFLVPLRRVTRQITVRYTVELYSTRSTALFLSSTRTLASHARENVNATLYVICRPTSCAI